MLDTIRKHFNIFLLAAGHGAVDLYLGLLPIVAPGLAIYLGIPLGDIVFLVGVAALLNNVMQLVAGHIMGWRNISWMLWFGTLLSVLPCFMGFASGYYSLAALVVLGAVGTGLYHPEGALAASDASGDKAYLGVPLFMAGGVGIYALGTPICIAMSEHLGFPSLVWLALPGLAVGALLWRQHQAARRDRPSQVLRPRSRRITKVREGVLSYWPLLGVSICAGVAHGLFMAIFTSHYELLFGPASRAWSGWVLMLIGFMSSASSFLWSALSRKYGFYKVTAVTQAIACPLFVLIAFPSSPAAGFAISIPLSIFYTNALNPVAVTLCRDAAGLTQGMRTSITMGGTAGLSSLAVMAAGGLLRRGVPSSSLILFVALCSFVACLLGVWQTLAAKRRR